MEGGGTSRVLAAEQERPGPSHQTASPRPNDGEPVALSNRLFDEAKAYLAAGDVVSACAAFARSNALVPRVGTVLNLGLCREKEGRFLLAREALQTALALLKKDGGRHDRVEIAVEHLRSVEAALSWLSFDMPEGPSAASVEVRVDGELIDVTADAIPVESGVHRITATAADCVPWDMELSVSPAAERRTIRIGPLVPLVPRVPPPVPATAPVTSVSTAMVRPETAPVARAESSSSAPTSEGQTRARRWLWVGGGVTVIAAAVVTVLLVSTSRSQYPSSTIRETYP